MLQILELRFGHKTFVQTFCSDFEAGVDKAPRLSISIVIWILSSDTICQLNQFNTNSEAAMLSRLEIVPVAIYIV